MKRKVSFSAKKGYNDLYHSDLYVAKGLEYSCVVSLGY